MNYHINGMHMTAQGVDTTTSAHTITQKSCVMVHVNTTAITIHHTTHVVTTRVAHPQPTAHLQSTAYLRPTNIDKRHNVDATGRSLQVSQLQLLHTRR